MGFIILHNSGFKFTINEHDTYSMAVLEITPETKEH